jgi:hypothetical protein
VSAARRKILELGKQEKQERNDAALVGKSQRLDSDWICPVASAFHHASTSLYRVALGRFSWWVLDVSS